MLISGSWFRTEDDRMLPVLRVDGGVAVFESRFAAFTDPKSLDMSVLGRDILNLFTLVVDRQSETVCLLRAPHRVAIHSA